MRFDGSRDTAAVPLATMATLEVSRGRHGHTAAGMGLGFLAGAVTGALAAGVACRDGCYSGSSDMTAPTIGVVAGLGAVAGGVVGGVEAIIGSAIKSDIWEEVPAARWHMTARRAGPGRMAIALSLSF